MPSIAYPTSPQLPDAGLQTAGFTAAAKQLYRCDTSSASFNVTLPSYGTGAVLGAPVMAAGVITSIPVTTAGQDYTVFSEITVTGGTVTTAPVLVPVLNAAGGLVSVTVTSGGLYSVNPTGATLSAGAKPGDEIYLADGKFSFGNNKLVVKTGNVGHRLAGQVAGTDLDIDANGQSVQLRCAATQGWTVVG
jgi:hypothetical protein